MDAKIVLGVNWPLQAGKCKVVTIRMSFKLLVWSSLKPTEKQKF